MSIFHRVVCSLLSLSLAISAGPMAYAAQKSKAPATKPATKAPATKSAPQSAKPRASAQAAATAPVKGAASTAALSKSIDLRHVLRDAFAVIVVHPRAFLEAPGMELFPREIMTAAAMKEAGVDPAKIDQVIISVG